MAALDDKLGPDDLDGIIAEIDTDGSGTVDFDGECGSINPFHATHPQNMFHTKIKQNCTIVIKLKIYPVLLRRYFVC